MAEKKAEQIRAEKKLDSKSGEDYIVIVRVRGVTGVKKLGMMTPLGGLAFLLGWLCLALAAKG